MIARRYRGTGGAHHDTVEFPTHGELPTRLSTAEQAAQVLRTQIAEGRLAPGARLRETAVAEAFAISRNTVREVFRLLAHERLLDFLPHRGVSVRRVSAAEVREVYVVRRLLEPLGATAALTQPTARYQLREAVANQSAAVAVDDWSAVGTADIEFHRILVGACGSVHLSALFDSLLAELRLAFLLLPDRRSLHEPYVARNATLSALLDAGDRQAASAEIEDYLATSERHVLSFVETADEKVVN